MAKKTSHYRYDTNRHQGSLFGDDADFVFNTPSQPEQAAKPADPAPKAVDADAIDSRLEVKVAPTNSAGNPIPFSSAPFWAGTGRSGPRSRQAFSW